MALAPTARATPVIWYSFYTGGGSIQACIHACAQKLLGAANDDAASRERALVAALASRRVVLVLDGLERALVAYHRHDAARTERDAGDHRFVEPGALPFLDALVAAKVPLLLTSRVMPRGLEGLVDVLDVERVALDDSVEIFPGVEPTRAAALLAAADGHALTARVLRPVVEAGVALALDAVDGAARRLAIFEAAWALLEPAHQAVLSSLAAFRGALDIALVGALLHAPDAQDGAIPHAPDEEMLRATLRDLEARGLVLYGRGRVVDLHPVVRGFAFGKLGAASAEDLIARLKPYRLSDERKRPRALADLGPEIDLFHMLCDRGREAEASALLASIERNLLRFGALLERLQMVQRLFPNGIEGPHVLAGRDISVYGTMYSSVLQRLGRVDEARAIDAWLLDYALEHEPSADDVIADLLNFQYGLDHWREQPLRDASIALAAEVDAATGGASLDVATVQAWRFAFRGDAEGFAGLASTLEPRLLARAAEGESSPRYDHNDVRYYDAKYMLALHCRRGIAEADADLERVALRDDGEAEDALILEKNRLVAAVLDGRREDATLHARRAQQLVAEMGAGEGDAPVYAYCAALADDNARARALLAAPATTESEPAEARAWRALTLAVLDDPNASAHAREAYAHAMGYGPAYCDAAALDIARTALAHLGEFEPARDVEPAPAVGAGFFPRISTFCAALRRVPAGDAMPWETKQWLTLRSPGQSEDHERDDDAYFAGDWCCWLDHRGASFDEALAKIGAVAPRRLYAKLASREQLAEIVESARSGAVEELFLNWWQLAEGLPVLRRGALRRLRWHVTSWGLGTIAPMLRELTRIGCDLVGIDRLTLSFDVDRSTEADDPGEALASLIAQLAPKHLEVAGLETTGVESLLAGIAAHPRLERLVLVHVGLSVEHIDRLVEALADKPGCTGAIFDHDLPFWEADRLRRALPNVLVG